MIKIAKVNFELFSIVPMSSSIEKKILEQKNEFQLVLSLNF